MKTLLFLMLLIPIFASSQQKYEKLFLQADSAFTAEHEAKELDEIFELIDADSMQITTEVSKLLQIYICAYIDGYCDGNKPFNPTELKANVLNQRKAMLFWIRFLKDNQTL